MTINTVTLNTGVVMPAMGFGVFQTPPEATADAVAEALRVGYRLIDTAAAYGNERGVGEGIRRSGLDRSEVFIETKIWISDYGYEETLHSFTKSAGKLGVDQIDLLLLHQPVPTTFGSTVGAYKALEKLLADGAVRAIGISNFMPEVLADLLSQTDIVPAVNQVEGIVTDTVFLGRHARFCVSALGQNLIVSTTRLDQIQSIRAQSKVRLGWDPDEGQVLDG